MHLKHIDFAEFNVCTIKFKKLKFADCGDGFNT